jgi:hypothetical protein
MISNPLSRRASWLAIIVVAASTAIAPAQVIYPKPPKEYDVSLRFQIRTPLPGWYDRFDEMVAALKGMGFIREPLPEGEPLDPSNDILKGIIASDNAEKLLGYPAVQTVLLVPHGAKLKSEERVKVRLKLASGLGLETQLKLKRQLMDKLEQIGFRESIGYDHHEFTWLVGTIEVPRLGELLRDARTIPDGWLTPIDPISTLDEPLRNRIPVRLIEALPEPADIPPAQEPPAPPKFSEADQHLAKIAPELRPLIYKEGDDTKFLRVEVVLDRTPLDVDTNWERIIRSTASSVRIEGRLGNIVSVHVKATQAGELARPYSVIQVRLPRSGQSSMRPAMGPATNAIVDSRVGRLHDQGQRGRGIKVVVVGGDFGGYEKFLGKGLPQSTRLIDLTASRNPSLEPDPMPSTDGAIGQGTLTALATHQGAPDAELVLVRIDPAAPYQLLLLARLINEPRVIPRVMDERYAEITRERTSIEESRVRVMAERRKAIDTQVFDEGDTRVPEQRRRIAESKERVKRAEESLKEVEKLSVELQHRTERYLLRQAELQAVQGARVVVCPLSWNEGFPLDGASALSRYLDEKPFVGHPGDPTKSRIPAMVRNRGTVWVQASGDDRGQMWTGLFRDADGNGAMEFTPVGAPLPRGRWNSEMNFLAWQDFEGKSVPDLPEKVRLRVTMQWREPHDPSLSAATDDPYRTPIANLGLLVLKQRDPNGMKLPSDDMEVVARTYGTPVRLQLDSMTGTYEAAVEFDAPAGGRFAVMVDGRAPASIRPAGDIAGGAAGIRPEIRPRLFVELVNRESQANGRAVFMDYTEDAQWPPAEMANQTLTGMRFAGVGMPADAVNALTIGAADASGKARFYTSVGAGPLRELLIKPNFLGYDGIEVAGTPRAGSWVATGFEGGTVACLIGANTPAQVRQLIQILQVPQGTVLRIPENWLK